MFLIRGDKINVVDSLINVGIGSVIDVGFEKLADKVSDALVPESPNNYSTYAHQARKKNPNLTRDQIRQCMRHEGRVRNVVDKAVSVTFDVFRNALPY